MEKIVEVIRGGSVESIHYGSIAVVDSEERVIAEAGDSSFVTFLRSAAKPFVSMCLVSEGAAEKFGLTPAEIAIISSSHGGQKEQIAVVTSILAKLDLDESYLRCGYHLPFHQQSAEELLRNGEKPREIHCTCSGKHAGMLAICRLHGYPLENYDAKEHPLQKMLFEQIAGIMDAQPNEIVLGQDGCGVPVYALPIKKMACGFMKLATGIGLDAKFARAAKDVYAAMTNNPFMVSGSGEFCTELMEVTGDKLVAKEGAEGIFCIGVRDRRLGIALKVMDGQKRAMAPAIVETLRQLQILTDEELEKLKKWHFHEIRNHRKEVVGILKPNFTLKKIGQQAS